jgi:hypothetical protein
MLALEPSHLEPGDTTRILFGANVPYVLGSVILDLYL